MPAASDLDAGAYVTRCDVLLLVLGLIYILGLIITVLLVPPCLFFVRQLTYDFVHRFGGLLWSCCSVLKRSD
jgi:hypothetical protein